MPLVTCLDARDVRVRDLMTANPIAAEASTTPRELARLLLDHAISGVPVIDEYRRVIGVASRSDLLQWCMRGGMGFGASDLLRSLADGKPGTRAELVDLGIVADFMTSVPITAEPDDSIGTVALRMRDRHVHRVVVIDETGCLIGILTTFDMLKVFGDSPE